jgi:hypothetical protein
MLQQQLLRKPSGDREMVDILALVLQHDEQAVLSAAELALEAGVPTKTHVLNLLQRLIDGKPVAPPTIDAPQALTLANEPKADVERYDALRETAGRAMHHNPTSGAIVIMLRSLKMYGLARPSAS